MNWGRIIGLSLIALTLAASIGYALAHDWRRSLYFLFAAAINGTVVY